MSQVDHIRELTVIWSTGVRSIFIFVSSSLPSSPLFFIFFVLNSFPSTVLFHLYLLVHVPLHPLHLSSSSLFLSLTSSSTCSSKCSTSYCSTTCSSTCSRTSSTKWSRTCSGTPGWTWVTHWRHPHTDLQPQLGGLSWWPVEDSTFSRVVYLSTIIRYLYLMWLLPMCNSLLHYI